MATGIGKHKYSCIGKGAYDESIAICPYCDNQKCYADWVDIGIGIEQCGPFYCMECGASEISYLDKRELSEEEMQTGWYMPGMPVSENANTAGGVLVDHVSAKKLYAIGLLDKK